MKFIFGSRTAALPEASSKTSFERSMAKLVAGFLSAVVLAPVSALAANYFVEDTKIDAGVNQENAKAATLLIKNAVSARPADALVADEYRADYVLQPRIMQLGDSLILTIEKNRGDETLFAAQTKITDIDQLDRAARSATFAAIDEPTLPRAPRRSIASVETEPAIPYQVAPGSSNININNSASGSDQAPTVGRSQSQLPDQTVYPFGRKVAYWSVGAGPFGGRRLETSGAMYNFNLARVWDINPRASVKILGEAAFSSGDDSARFFNVAGGASYFFPGQIDSAPYLTADLGYGYAEDGTNDDADGFTFGTGVGYQFFRTTETTLDVLVRYAVLFDKVDADDTNPSILGVRLAVNF